MGQPRHELDHAANGDGRHPGVDLMHFAVRAFSLLVERLTLGRVYDIGKLGKAETTVVNIVRLLQLPPKAQKALHDSSISEGHARQVLALKDSTKLQDQLVDLVIKNGWSVRQAEQFVVAHKKGAATAAQAKKTLITQTPATKKLSTYVNAPVRIRRTAKGGEIAIGFHDDKDMERILMAIQS